jgi:photosystem II stability/assembly factor-like uncharacterized protein
MTRRAWRRTTLIEVATVAGLVATVAFDSGGVPASAQQSGWTLVQERPLAGKYEDFAFPTAKQGWLAAALGDILHTTDGGSTWTVQASGKGRLRSIDFLDETRGFAGTLGPMAGNAMASLWMTTNGGATWTDIAGTLPRPPKGFCGMAHVGDEFHVVGKYTAEAADYFYSPDAGKTWRAIDMKPMMQGLVEVVFLNESVGFIGGMSYTGPPAQGPAAMLKTTDGGKTWRNVFTHDGGRGFVWKIFPVTSKLIYAALQSQDGIYRVAKSLDAGDTWEVLTAATGRPNGPAVQGIGFLNENTGWIGGFFPGMYATTDGGRTWAPLDIPGGTINRIEKLDGRTMITASTRGILRYTGQAEVGTAPGPASDVRRLEEVVAADSRGARAEITCGGRCARSGPRPGRRG